MRRPPGHDWAVLGESGDPIPGDPDAVAVLGAALRVTADDIQREADEIHAPASVESWKSKAADAFRDAAGDAITTLHKAFHRYDVASEAMGTHVREGSEANWASALETAQQMAAKALRDAQTANADHQAAVTRLHQLSDGTPSTDPSSVALRKKQEAAEGSLTKARAALQVAVGLRDRAASHAADRIQ